MIPSSSGTTTSIFEFFGLPNIGFALITTLSATNPTLYFQFLRVISYVIFPSVLWSPLWPYLHRFPLIFFFLPFSLPPFDVNGQTSLIVVLLCYLLHSYVLLIRLIHRPFRFSMYRLFLSQDQRSFITLSFQIKTMMYSTVPLPVVLYGCETWSVTLREEHRLRCLRTGC